MNKFYEECLGGFINSPTTRDLFDNQEMTYRDYKNKKLTTERALGDYYDIHMPLIDAQLVHKIYELQKNEMIIVCAGNFHTGAIAPVLETMGYQIVKESHKADEAVRLLTVSPEFFDAIQELK